MVGLVQAVLEQILALSVLSDNVGQVIELKSIDKSDNVVAVLAQRHCICLRDGVFSGEFFVLLGRYRLDGDQITREFVQANDDFVALTLIDFELDLVLIQLVGVPLSSQGCLEYFLAKPIAHKVDDSIVARLLRDLDRVKKSALTLGRLGSLTGGR